MKFNQRNITIGENVKIGKNVKIGDHTIIYDNVILEDDVIVANHCVIGEPLNDYYHSESYQQPQTVIGAKSLIRSHSIIYAGTEMGASVATGHRVTIREYSIIGHHAMLGSYSDIQGFCRIGHYNRLHSYVNIGQKSELGDYVFIYPFVVLTNDPTPPSNELIGPKIGDYTQIAAAAVILPGAEVGQHCLVGANSVVGGRFSDDTFIAGNPARAVGALSKMPFFNTEGKRHYPWPHHFERGMPWQGIGYHNWLKDNNDD